ncbi:MAG: FKBP-type peptidyl-prolyl cis-trans isomerase [Methanobacteriota archaeon]|nr:MAG: FKBP-type peptidyl-prolyl cis-trans isomerase [Euryarchaeota archaeon]
MLTVAAILVSVGIIGFVVYDNMGSHSSASSAVIAMDDVVTMDYVGRFSSELIFDTSLLEIAENDVIYPKSLTFTMRENDSYAPFEMVAGKYGEEGGTIKGFALGVIGLSVGDTAVIDVAPEDAYPVNPDMIETIPLVQRVDGTETLSESEFKSLFKIDAEILDYVPHYKWKWDVLVINIEFGYVTFKHFPTIGETVYPFGDPYDINDPAGWPCVVESFNPSANEGEGEVVVKHLVTEADVYAVKGVSYDDEVFVISSFDFVNETFEVHRSDSTIGYNGEISGRALFFEVTIISVSKT